MIPAQAMLFEPALGLNVHRFDVWFPVTGERDIGVVSRIAQNLEAVLQHFA